MDNGKEYFGKTVILTTGTYLKAEILVGDQKTPSGPDQERQSLFLSDRLTELGFRIQRLKTGTPPRVDIESVDLKLNYNLEPMNLLLLAMKQHLIFL